MLCISRCSPLQTLRFAVAEPVRNSDPGVVAPSSRIPSFVELQDQLSHGNTGKNPSWNRSVQRGAVGQAGSEEELPTHPGIMRTRIASALSVIGILGKGWCWWCPCHQCLN